MNKSHDDLFNKIKKHLNPKTIRMKSLLNNFSTDVSYPINSE